MWGCCELADSLVLIVSELVTNAVVHARCGAGRQVALTLVRGEGAVRVEVRDSGRGGRGAARGRGVHRGERARARCRGRGGGGLGGAGRGRGQDGVGVAHPGDGRVEPIRPRAGGGRPCDPSRVTRNGCCTRTRPSRACVPAPGA
ncbi:ATP-binding protein [Streptomyces sp. NRRL F-5630]|uniref:ATP-binding protein n=1 Tax=Streptomyces sp. NRRL F-5630 TaxID=1463864 RepID=UPI003D72692C